MGTVGDVEAFSLCQSKHFTTGGEGGAVITDDEDVAWQCRPSRDHGDDVKERMRLLEVAAKLPYIHNMVGFDYRMTEIQLAIGLRELVRFDFWNLPAQRRATTGHRGTAQRLLGVPDHPGHGPAQGSRCPRGGGGAGEGRCARGSGLLATVLRGAGVPGAQRLREAEVRVPGPGSVQGCGPVRRSELPEPGVARGADGLRPYHTVYEAKYMDLLAAAIEKVLSACNS